MTPHSRTSAGTGPCIADLDDRFWVESDPTGDVLQISAVRAMRGMRHAIAAMAAQGNNLIVDDVLIGEGEFQDYQALLSRFELRVVGLFAPLDVLKKRERARGDRKIDLARWQYDRVHHGVSYDLEPATAASTLRKAAQRIRDTFQL